MEVCPVGVELQHGIDSSGSGHALDVVRDLQIGVLQQVDKVFTGLGLQLVGKGLEAAEKEGTLYPYFPSSFCGNSSKILD